MTNDEKMEWMKIMYYTRIYDRKNSKFINEYAGEYRNLKYIYNYDF